MKRSDAFPSNYLSKDDVDPPITATIAGVKRATLKGEDGDETKPVMTFDGSVKPLIINNANWMTCEDLYGEDSDGWIGKSIEIYKDASVMFGNKRVGGVRLRKPNGAQAQAEQPAKPSQAMLEKWQVLYEKAIKLKIDCAPIPADISAQELARRGKALRDLIEAAEF